MNIQVYQTDVGLGYGEYVYLLRLNKSKNGYNYLCIGKNCVYELSMYEIGEVVNDLHELYVELSDYNIVDSPLYTSYLFKYFLDKEFV